MTRSTVSLDEWGGKILTAVGHLADKLERSASSRAALPSAPAPGLRSGSLKESGLQVTRDSRTSVNDLPSIQSDLAWKIISTNVDPSVRVSILPDSRESSNGSASRGHASGSTSKADLIKLRDSFVTYVLPKVPVLSVSRLDGYILQIGENGAEWSSESCLVFLVAALGVASRRYSHDEIENGTVVEPSNVQSKTDEAAFWYWNMAKKRLGWALEENGLLAAQCLCLAGFVTSVLFSTKLEFINDVFGFSIWHLLNYEPLPALTMFQNTLSSLARKQHPHTEGIAKSLGGIEDGRLTNHVFWICRSYQR